VTNCHGLLKKKGTMSKIGQGGNISVNLTEVSDGSTYLTYQKKHERDDEA